MQDETIARNDLYEREQEAKLNVFSRVQIQEKYAEPDKDDKYRQLNRNFILGNIQRGDELILTHQRRIAQLLERLPDKYGGYVLQEYADVIMEGLNFQVVASNSVNAIGRMSAVTSINKIENKDLTNKGFLSGMMRSGSKDG